MRAILILLLAASGCTTVNVKVVDYCHNQDGTINTDDPQCQTQNPLRFYYDKDLNTDRK